MAPTFSRQVRQPQQGRSRATMNQILDAAARILERKTFEELTIAEVVQLAGTSVGAFYGRFHNKDALLLALEMRYFEEFEQNINTLISNSEWKHKAIPVIVRDLVDFMISEYSRNPGLLRSLHLKSRMQKDGPFKDREHRFWIMLFPIFQNILLQHEEEINHPNPVLAAQLGLQQLVFAIHEMFLWGVMYEGKAYARDELCGELTRAFLAYLDVKDSS